MRKFLSRCFYVADRLLVASTLLLFAGLIADFVTNGHAAPQFALVNRVGELCFSLWVLSLVIGNRIRPLRW